MLCPLTVPPAIRRDGQLYHYGHVVVLVLDMHLGEGSDSYRCVKIGAGVLWGWQVQVVWWEG